MFIKRIVLAVAALTITAGCVNNASATELFSNDRKLNSINADRSPLVSAAQRGDIKEGEKYVSMIGQKNYLNETATTMAAIHCKPDFLAWLLGISDKELRTKDRLHGRTALIAAANHGFDHFQNATRCVQMLLAEAGLKDNRGWTALMHAARSGNAESVNLLVPFELGMQTSNGETALRIACLAGNPECVRLLTEEMHIPNELNETPLELARRSNEESAKACVEILEAAEAENKRFKDSVKAEIIEARTAIEKLSTSIQQAPKDLQATIEDNALLLDFISSEANQK